MWIESEDGQVALSDVWRCWRRSANTARSSPPRTAWQRVQEMETALGVRLLETTSGGVGGGGTSHLSPAALDLVRRYQAVRSGLDELVLERYRGAFHSDERAS